VWPIKKYLAGGQLFFCADQESGDGKRPSLVMCVSCGVEGVIVEQRGVYVCWSVVCGVWEGRKACVWSEIVAVLIFFSAVELFKRKK
jgi:hypothetical protein